jgi:hypothetical protein
MVTMASGSARDRPTSFESSCSLKMPHATPAISPLRVKKGAATTTAGVPSTREATTSEMAGRRVVIAA